MSNNFLYKYLSLIVVAFKDIVYIFYYEIHLKYCQDTDIYWYIDNLLQQWKTILRSLGKTEKSFSHILTDYFIQGVSNHYLSHFPYSAVPP
jgi:hypothetical protein